jgi:hypothetical protein
MSTRAVNGAYAGISLISGIWSRWYSTEQMQEFKLPIHFEVSDNS